MSRLEICQSSAAESAVMELYRDMARRSLSAPFGNCPGEQSLGFLRQCLSQSCGKCTPCRLGLREAIRLIDDMLEGSGTERELVKLEKLLQTIADSADCAVGFEAAAMVLRHFEPLKKDLRSHIQRGRCTAKFTPIPCVQGCPAHVDIPGYIALTKAERYADAIRVIRYDNPFPSVCALVCEHPCEAVCRRNLIDAPVNIRGIKRAAVDGAGVVEPPAAMEPTGKRIAVVGGGPSGLTAAYFLQLMGHQVDVYEQRPALGGMTRYGIPRYRLPHTYLDADIEAILATGVKAHTDVSVDGAMFRTLRKDFDAVYLAIGAQSANSLGIEGDDAEGVISAVALLRDMEEEEKPDLRAKRVAIVGGGNVAMDCTRTAVRLGAAEVTCVYRRRKEDMTAQAEEVEGAIAETCEIMTMMAPVRVETDEENRVKALVVQPQLPGAYDRGRPRPIKAEKGEVTIECDVIVAAIGQTIDSEDFAGEGIPTKWNRIVSEDDCVILTDGLVYAGGDCASGPSTVIRAVEAGKTAAANIDEALGYHHVLPRDIEIPAAKGEANGPTGRIDLAERPAMSRKDDFVLMEQNMSNQEMKQECSRCLRCDHHGLGTVKGGRRPW